MKQTDDMWRERVSALADGQLDDEELAQALGELGERDELRVSWHTYHLVGDVLRSGDHAPCSDPSAFLHKLQQRLAHESPRPLLQPVAQPVRRHVEAANEPVFRWKLVAGAASLAAAAAIGWNWMGSGAIGASSAGPQLAQQQQVQPAPGGGKPVLASNSVPTPATTATRVMIGTGNPQVMLRDPRLDALLEAHQQAGGASQMPSGFLRNATFEGSAR